MTDFTKVHAPSSFPGPQTRRRLNRLHGVLLALFVVGISLAFSSDVQTAALGLGLAFPGAGFLVHASGSVGVIALHLLVFLFVIVAYIASLIWWWWCGNILLPPLVWLGTAVLAAVTAPEEGAVHHHWHGAPWVVIALAALLVGFFFVRNRRARSADAEDLARNQKALVEAQSIRTPRQSNKALAAIELTPDDLAAQRFALDRALQPVDEFQGFHFGDQWQLPATRYQVFTLGWALALANHNALPAMRGYLQDAQLRLIEKTRNPLLWRYWRWENMWGNLRLNADPLAHDNIMYSGYVGKQIGLYQAATGDLQHDQPGAYTLVDGKHGPYVYSFTSLVERLVAQYQSSQYCLWPCEPNWIYVFCNTTAAVAIRAYDATHNTNHWASIEARFQQSLIDEFTTPGGEITELRSAYTGFTPGFTNGPGTSINAATGLHPLLPDHAEQIYWLSRAQLLEQSGGVSRLIDGGRPEFDPGNLKPTAGYQLGVLLHGAKEFGDVEMIRAVEQAIATKVESSQSGGVLTHKDVSVWGHSLMLMGRVGVTNGLHDLSVNAVPEAVRKGPVISQASYPKVLVASATNDGRALQAVVYPGNKPGVENIGVSQLVPGKEYCLLGGENEQHVCADAAGEVSIALPVDGRTEFMLNPI